MMKMTFNFTGKSKNGDETCFVSGSGDVDGTSVKFKGELFLPQVGSNVKPFVRDGQIPEQFMASVVNTVRNEQKKRAEKPAKK